MKIDCTDLTEKSGDKVIRSQGEKTFKVSLTFIDIQDIQMVSLIRYYVNTDIISCHIIEKNFEKNHEINSQHLTTSTHKFNKWQKNGCSNKNMRIQIYWWN